MNCIKNKIKPSYKQTPVGIIPEDWEVKKLGELCELKSGGTPLRSKPEYWDGQIPWLTTSLINYNIINSVEQYITEAGLENSSTKIFPQGTTVIAIYGQGVTRGKVARLGFDMATNQACVAFLNQDLNFQNFLFYSLESNYGRLRNLSNDGSQKNLSSKLLGNFKLPIPPLPEQEQISSCLTTWDQGIEKLSVLIEAKKQQKKGVMQGLFNGQMAVVNGQLIQAREGEGFRENWEEIKMDDIGSTFNGLTGKTKENFGAGKPYVTYLNTFRYNKIDRKIEFDYVEIKEDENQSKLQYGDLLFTTSSETPNEVGMSSVILFEPKEDLYLNSFCFGLRPMNFKTILPEFAVYVLRAANFRKEMYKLGQGSTRFNISKTGFRKISLKLPSLKEQTGIAEVLITLDKEIVLLEQKLETIQLQKKGLMQVLLTGKKRLV